MRSLAPTIAWQIWGRQRAGLWISMACLLIMVLLFPPVLARFDDNAAVVGTLIPATLVSAFIVNAVLFTEEVGSMTSGYPRRMLTLPVATRTLAFWPLLIAVLTTVALWLTISVLIYRRGGYHPPLVLPALALAVCIAWIQTICWLPIRGALIRQNVLFLGFLALLAVPAWLWQREILSHSLVAALGGLELIGLFALACVGLAYDRRGDDWTFGAGRAVEWCRSIYDRSPRQSPSLRDASAAQEWYESRCHSSLLTGLILCLQVFLGVIYLWLPRENVLAHRIGLASFLGMPLLIAGSQGSTLGRMRPLNSKERGPITFLAVRPILTGEMVVAKYRMVARNVAVIWLITLAMAAALVIIKGQAAELAALLNSFLLTYPGWRGWAVLGLAIALAPVFTWKLLTDNVAGVLTGRRWLAEGSEMLGAMIFLGMIVVSGWYAGHLDLLARHLPIAVWMLAGFVVLKCILAVVGIRAALDRGLLHVQSVRRLLALLAAMALATISLAHLLIPYGSLAVPRPVVLLSTLCMLPLARFALAPLALDWNRHR